MLRIEIGREGEDRFEHFVGRIARYPKDGNNGLFQISPNTFIHVPWAKMLFNVCQEACIDGMSFLSFQVVPSKSLLYISNVEDQRPSVAAEPPVRWNNILSPLESNPTYRYHIHGTLYRTTPLVCAELKVWSEWPTPNMEIYQWPYLVTKGSTTRVDVALRPPPGMKGNSTRKRRHVQLLPITNSTFRSYMKRYPAPDIPPFVTWDTSDVTDMTDGFGALPSTLDWNDPQHSIVGWDVSNVVSMRNLFHNQSTFNQPIGDWNVSKVKTMNGMFDGATRFDQPLNKWKTTALTDMKFMFHNASSFNQPIDNWTVDKVRSMRFLFAKTMHFNQPLNRWNVSHVSDMSYMFAEATSFNQPLDQWDVSRVTHFDHQFMLATTFNQSLKSWNVTRAASMVGMLQWAFRFNADLFDLPHMVELDGFAEGAQDLQTLPTHWRHHAWTHHVKCSRLFGRDYSLYQRLSTKPNDPLFLLLQRMGESSPDVYSSPHSLSPATPPRGRFQLSHSLRSATLPRNKNTKPLRMETIHL